MLRLRPNYILEQMTIGIMKRIIFAVVKKNGVNVYADTGVNGQFNDVTAKKAMMDNIRISGNNIVTTGNAKAKAKTWMVVNSSWLY